MLNAGNGCGMIPKLSVNRGVHYSLRKNETSSDSSHIVGECSWIALEQNAVQDTLAALLVHSHSSRIKSTVDVEMN